MAKTLSIEKKKVKRKKIKKGSRLTPEQINEAENLLMNVLKKLRNKLSMEIQARTEELARSARIGFLSNLLSKDEKLRKRMDEFEKHHKSFILPTGTRFFSSYDDSKVLVIQQEPQVRNMKFSESFFEADKKNYRLKSKYPKEVRKIKLAFPYVIFVVKIKEGEVTGLWVYYSNMPLTSTDNYLYYPNLPDIGSGHEFSFKPKASEPESIKQTVEEAIEGFWRHTFSDKNMAHYQNMQTSKTTTDFRNIWRWENKSLKDPRFALKTMWPVSTYTLEKLLRKLCRQGNPLFRKRFKQFVITILRKYMKTAKKASVSGISNIDTNDLYKKTISNMLQSEVKKVS